jgi:hypothetical protein
VYENGSTSHLDATAAETTRHIDATFTEMFEGLRRHFDVAMEKISHKLDLLEERAVSLDQNFDRTMSEIRAEMRSGFAETWAVLKSFQRPEDSTE